MARLHSNVAGTEVEIFVFEFCFVLLRQVQLQNLDWWVCGRCIKLRMKNHVSTVDSTSCATFELNLFTLRHGKVGFGSHMCKVSG